MAGWTLKAEPNPLAPTTDHYLDHANDIMQEIGKDQNKSNPENKDKKVTKDCPNCNSGDREPDFNADAYERINGRIIDTLTRNPITNKVDTSGKKH